MSIYLVLESDIFREQNSSGSLSCDITEPSCNLEATVRTSKGLVNTWYVKMTFIDKLIFRVSKPAWKLDVHINFAPFLVSAVRSVPT